MRFSPAQPRTANCQSGHARSISSLRQRLPQPETLRDPPGLFAAANYETLTLRLLAGDSVLFCTDGISDAFRRKEETIRNRTAARALGRPAVRLAHPAARTGLRCGREFFPRAGTAKRYGCGTLSSL